MRRLIIATAAVATLLAAAPASFAQSRGGQQCPPNQRNCVQQDSPRPGNQEQRPRAGRADQAAQPGRPAPRIGENGRGGRQFERASSSRFKAPPRGQEYRVVNDHLVLVDSNTLKIVTVLGLLNTLLN